MIVDFQGVGLVGNSLEFFGNLDHALSYGELAPLFSYGFADNAIKLRLPLEGGGQGEFSTGMTVQG